MKNNSLKNLFKSDKLKQLEIIIKDIRENHLANWKLEKEEELKEQLENFVYNKGEKKGEKISKELQIWVKNLLKQQEIITKDRRDDCPVVEVKEEMINGLSEWIEKEKLEGICNLKVQIVQAEQFSKLNEPLEDITIFKNFLTSILQISKENNELKVKLWELEKEMKELWGLIEGDDEKIKKILTKKISNLLSLKKDFLNSREQIINQLRNCCNELESNLAIKFAIVEESAKLTAAAGKLVERLSPVKFIEFIGDTASAINSINQRIYKDQKGNEFKLFLLKTEPELKALEGSCRSLLTIITFSNQLEISKEIISALNLTEQLTGQPVKIFTNYYQFYDVITNIWPNKSHISTEDMKDAISALHTNYLVLQEEVRVQEQYLQRISVEVNINQQALVTVPPK